MAKQKEPFTKIPDKIFDDPTLDPYEFRIMYHIARQTIGYGKKSDGISLSQFARATGISKSKIQDTLQKLKEEKRIKITNQTSRNGGISYNRYELTLYRVAVHLYRDTVDPIPRDGQGLYRDTVIQEIIEQEIIDKRRETETHDDVFDLLSDHEFHREANRYADHLSESASKPAAYKRKILRQIARRDQTTLDGLREWYMEESCERLTKAYAGKVLDGYRITSIYPFTQTKGYHNADFKLGNIFFAQGEDERGETIVWEAVTVKELEDQLHDAV